MGFDRATVQFLLQAPRLGISLDRVLTIGRQSLYLTPADLEALFIENGRACTPAEAERLHRERDGYAEPLLHALGAREVESIDISDYEHASLLHDMNQPLPERLHQQFSLVIDGGSLEHVFQYPTAIANCLHAVSVKGHVLLVTPANNLMGHGFYQFSPELLFRVLSPENGYRLTHMLLYEYPWTGDWYEVADPQKVGYRLQFNNLSPAYLLACAQRTAVVPLFAQTPQQSDYSRVWQESAAGAAGQPAKPHGWKQLAPAWVGDLYRRVRPFHPRYYRKVPPRLD